METGRTHIEIEVSFKMYIQEREMKKKKTNQCNTISNTKESLQ